MVALLLICGSAFALSSDRDQPIDIHAASFSGSQDSGKYVYTGNVVLDQGSFHATGDRATAYTDPNDNSQWQRGVLTGNPAHFQQKQDSGTMVHGQAATLDYRISENTVILTGNAVVIQDGKGEFHGAKLVYNTDTGQIVGQSGEGGQVHMILQPKAKPTPASKSSPASKPASASTTAKPAIASTAAARPSATASATSTFVPPTSGASAGTH